MSTPNRVAVMLQVELDIEPVTPSTTRAQFLQAARTAVVDAHASGLIEQVIAEEFLAVLPAPEPRQ